MFQLLFTAGHSTGSGAACCSVGSNTIAIVVPASKVVARGVAITITLPDRWATRAALQVIVVIVKIIIVIVASSALFFFLQAVAMIEVAGFKVAILVALRIAKKVGWTLGVASAWGLNVGGRTTVRSFRRFHRSVISSSYSNPACNDTTQKGHDTNCTQK